MIDHGFSRITHVQPALPRYRLDFFDRLSRQYGPSMKVHYSPGSLGALTRTVDADWAVEAGAMRSVLGKLAWQPGIAGLAVDRGDIVVLSGNPRQLSTMVLLLRAKLSGAKVIWWGHYWSSTSRKWRQSLRRLPMSLADAILYYTDQEVLAHKAESGEPKGSALIAALNNGLDFEPIRKRRAPYVAGTRDRALLFVGRLTAKANLGLSFEAMARLGAHAPMLHVIGTGVEEDNLRSKAAELEIGDKVVWHGALTNEDAISEVANTCQAFVYPGEVGLSLIHAMAYGLPAIVHDSNNFHMPEIAAFRNGLTGMSFEHGSVRSLSDAIAAMLADEDRLLRFSDGAKSVVGPSFTTEDMASRFIALVKQLEQD